MRLSKEEKLKRVFAVKAAVLASLNERQAERVMEYALAYAPLSGILATADFSEKKFHKLVRAVDAKLGL